MRKGFLIYEQMSKYPYMRRPLVIYDFATALFQISLYMRKILFYFLSVWNEVFCENYADFCKHFLKKFFVLAFFDEGHSMVEVSGLFVLFSVKKV
jgi:hypothetical protein